MPSARVLDSWAILAYLEGQPAGGKVCDLLKETFKKEEKLLISVVNWGEILYTIEMRYGKERLKEIRSAIDQIPLDLISADTAQAQEAAHFKAEFRLPYSDCYAASLAFMRKTELVTGDKDFRRVEGKIKIMWL